MKSTDSAGPDNNTLEGFFRFKLQLWGLFTAAGTLAAAVSIGGFFGHYAWWLDIGSHFRVQYTIGFAAMAVCYALGRKKRWTLCAFCMAFLNVLPVITLLLPPTKETASGTDSLKAVLINVNTQTGNPAEVLSFLEKENPDIIVLEEISHKWINELGPLYEKYPIRTIKSQEDNFGIGLFCRGEEITAEIVSLGSAQVPSIISKIRLAGHVMTILATHPVPPVGSLYWGLRNEQLEQIAQKTCEIDGPLMLLGDLNTTPWSYHYRALIQASGLKNSSKSRGIYATWPTFAWPLQIPLDHCLHTEDIVILNKQIGPDIGSDHYPVIITFTLREV